MKLWAALMPLLAVPVVLGFILLPKSAPPLPLGMPIARVVVTDDGCALASGDLVVVSVLPNHHVGVTLLRHTGGRTFTAEFAGRPPVKTDYFIEFHGGAPWGQWVSRKQLIQPVLHIDCRGSIHQSAHPDQPDWMPGDVDGNG